MIGPDLVTQDIFSKVEGSIWRNVQRIKGYDWYQTGYAISVAPTEHELIEYGREWALATYLQDGGRWQDAVEAATKAMYRYAYDDIKPYIKYTKRERRRIDVREVAYDWSETPLHRNQVEDPEKDSFDTYLTTAREPLYYQQPEYDYEEFELFINQLPLTPRGKQMALMYAHGFKIKEIAEHLGISTNTADFHRKKLLPALRSHYGKIL